MISNLYVVGNKVDVPEQSKISKHQVSDVITFIGKMSYDPNIVAVNYFASEIFPILQKINSSLKFYIVGANPSEKIKDLGLNQNIVVTGFVESVEPFYQDSTIIVAPMLTGAGIQNKIIQAMSYGCCVVTTTIGAEGLDIQHGEIGIADTTKEMIAMMSALLQSRDKRVSMGLAARKYVEENLSEKVISEQFWNFIFKK